VCAKLGVVPAVVTAWGALRFVHLTGGCSGCQMEEDETGGACGRHREGRELNTVQGFDEE
jgi:hypothetical protein